MILYFLLFFITNSQEWTIYNKDNSDLLSNYIQDVIIDNEDNLWLINDFSTIFKIKDGIWTKFNSQNTGIDEFDFKSFSIGQNNVLFTGPGFDSRAWICKYINNTWVEIPNHDTEIYRSGIAVNDLIEFENGDILIATSFGAYYFKNGKWSSYLQSDEGRDLWGIELLKNEKYIFASNRFFKFNENLDRFDRIDPELPNDIRFTRFYDGLYNSIFTFKKTDSTNLKRFDGVNWYDFDISVLDTAIRNIILTNDGRFIFQTVTSVYECFDENNFTKIIDIPKTLGDRVDLIRLECVDSKGNYWFTIFNESLIKCSLDINSVPKKVEIKL